MQSLSDQSEKDDMSMSRLYQRYWLILFTAIRQYIPSREDAEDILLDVFLAALESKTLFSRNERSQEAWLRRVAYNKCMDFHRRATRKPTLLLVEEYEETFPNEDQQNPELTLLHWEELTQLQACLGSLSKHQQEMLRLRFADELPCAQIATRMHKSEGSIRTMLSRTLNHLREIYSGRKENGHEE